MDGLLDAFTSLGRNINKALGRSGEQENEQGVVSEKFPELTLTMNDKDIIDIFKKREATWLTSNVYSEWIKHGDENEAYWKGKQTNQPRVDKRRPLVDNVVYEALETYLPQVTRRNPDPMVTLAYSEEQSEENLKYAKDIQKELGELADELVLRLKLKKTARHWAIYLIGAAKFGWDMNRDIPTVKIIRPRKLILDPDATVEEDGYTGKYIGEYRKLEAGMLIDTLEIIGGDKDGIGELKKLAVDKNGGEALDTEIGFIEWHTDEYMCWILKDKHVLLKKKNPHWNYDTKKDAPYNEQGEPELDGEGKPVQEDVVGINHLPVPKMPFLLLSVFNLGKQPVDDTSLIGQNLAMQDLLNGTLNQIAKNVASMNGGMAVSLERSGLTKEQAKGVTEAVRKGGTVVIPSGSVQDAIARLSAPALPPDVYNQALDLRTRMRDLFGTSGSSSAGLSSEETVRGKLQNRMLDTDRIGGGFSEYLEQFADGIYNYFVQLLYVYDERFNNGQPKPRIKVSVKEGSLLPKDSTTIANQSIDLANAGKMSLLDLYKNLDYPNPEEIASNVWLEINAPELLYSKDPRVLQVIQSRQEAAGKVEEKPVSESINFKDLPPEGQAQMAKKVGIELHPEAIAAHDSMKVERDRSIPQPKVPVTPQ